MEQSLGEIYPELYNQKNEGNTIAWVSRVRANLQWDIKRFFRCVSLVLECYKEIVKMGMNRFGKLEKSGIKLTNPV